MNQDSIELVLVECTDDRAFEQTRILDPRPILAFEHFGRRRFFSAWVVVRLGNVRRAETSNLVGREKSEKQRPSWQHILAFLDQHWRQIAIGFLDDLVWLPPIKQEDLIPG